MHEAVEARALPGTALYTGYLVAQAIVGIVLWILWGTSTTVRSWFELVDDVPAAMDAFVFADLLVGVAGSALGAVGVWRGARWAAPVVTFVAGGLVYSTLYLIAWVSFAETGALTLAIMVPPAIINPLIALRLWERR